MLRTTWTDTIDAGSLETTTVNGLPVAIAAVARQGLVVPPVGHPDRRHHLPADPRRARPEPATSRRFPARPWASVRQITAEEAHALRPPADAGRAQRGEGDTAEAFADRMAVGDRPLERFMLLNGLERGGPLRAGERYKIVVE